MNVSSMRVDPASVCWRARGLVQEGDSLAAIKLLGDCFVGIDLTTSTSILEGISTLRDNGKGGADLVSDASAEAAEYKDFLHETFGHRIRIDGKWHEPYAVVVDVHKKDWVDSTRFTPTARERAWDAWAWATRGVTGNPPERNQQHVNESLAPLHYSDDPNAERMAYLKVGPYFDGGVRTHTYMREMGCPVLFRPCDAPPPWIKEASTLLEAAQRGLETLSTRRRGHRIEYEDRMCDAPDLNRREYVVPDVKRYLEEKRLAASPDPRTPAQRSAANVIAEPRPEDVILVLRRMLPALREKILAQAEVSGGFMQIDFGSGPVPVPRAPFEQWALKPVRMQHLAPDWRSVSPPDLKISRDNQDHSDWMIGAGLDPFSWHDWGEQPKRLREAGYEAMYALQEDKAKVRHAVLAGSGVAIGPVWHAKRGEFPPLGAIVVLPDASPSWFPAVQAALGGPGVGGVIVEQGGAMAHLVTVLREGGAPVIRWPGAREALVQVTNVRVDCETGIVEALDYDLVVPPEFDEDEVVAPGM